MSQPATDSDKRIALLERRLKREKTAREQAESLLTEKSQSLFNALLQSQQSQTDLELALWASQESFWSWHADTGVMEIRSFSLHSGKRSSWSGTVIELLARVHEDDIENLQYHWSMALQGGRDRIELSFRLLFNTDYQWIRLRGRVLKRGKANQALNIVGTTKDITQQRKAEHSFDLMASAFASSREPMLVLTPELIITECNDAFIRMLEMPVKENCIGLNFNELLTTQQVDKAQLMHDKQTRFESTVESSSSETRIVDISVAVFEAYRETSSYLIATLRDISDRKRSEERLRQLAQHDDLTGLSNRNSLNGSIESYADSGDPFFLIFLDLDGFKAINDTAGHDKGDEELQRVAALLTAIFGPIGEVGRWGGDEFLVVLRASSPDSVREKCEKLIEHIEADVIYAKGTELRLSSSIGVAAFPEHSDDIKSLIQCADAAMYRAKELGKGQVFIYESGLYESMTQQVSMVNDLRKAVENHLLDFYIQGKYDLHGNLKGGEVLCRWISGLHGVVSPTVFIPIAEEQNLDSIIGLCAIEAACDYISIMESQQGEAIPLSVNISANQMLDKDFPEKALSICRTNHVSPEYIEMELTESVFIRDEQAALHSLNALKAFGFRLSLDDFGSGFSSLNYLRIFQFQVVKIDRSLVYGVYQDSKAFALFSGLVTMLRSLKIEVVAEGIELETYLPFMEQADVQLMQGFYFDKPMPYDQFLARQQMDTNR